MRDVAVSLSLVKSSFCALCTFERRLSHVRMIFRVSVRALLLLE